MDVDIRGCGPLTVTSAVHREGAHAFHPQLGLPYTGRRYSRPLDDPAPWRAGVVLAAAAAIPARPA